MSVMRGELFRPKPQEVERYVYVKLLQPQVDFAEGKLPAGAVVTIPESKALRWVYRARIARAATEQEYLAYVRTNPTKQGFIIPDQVNFNYVEPDSDEGRRLGTVAQATDPDTSENPRRVSGASGDDNLGDRLAALTSEAEKAPPEPSVSVGPQVREQGAQGAQAGNYNDAISRGPMSKEERREARRNNG